MKGLKYIIRVHFYCFLQTLIYLVFKNIHLKFYKISKKNHSNFIYIWNFWNCLIFFFFSIITFNFSFSTTIFHLILQSILFLIFQTPNYNFQFWHTYFENQLLIINFSCYLSPNFTVPFKAKQFLNFILPLTK